MTTLVLSSRPTEDNQAIWRSAIARDWEVVRARGVRVPAIDDPEIVLYAESLFCPAIAASLGRSLLEIPEDWLVRLSLPLKKRNVTLQTLQAARQIERPAFIKPPNDKSFAAAVFPTGASLPVEYDEAMLVLVADPVTWTDEFRCFCLDGEVKTISPYLRSGEHAQLSDYQRTEEESDQVTRFVHEVLDASQAFTPRAVVIDVGKINGMEWAVVEANAAWGSGIYGCDPEQVLDVLRCATVQPE